MTGLEKPLESGPGWDTTASGEACMPNIGEGERKRRLIVGYVSLALAALGLAALLVMDAPRIWRLALFLPLMAAGAGFFQHREKT